MITAETLRRIRTYPLGYAWSGVYFIFNGTLFEDNGIEIKEISKFYGFNFATRQPDNLITSYEYVKFSNLDIPPIWNPEVNFSFPDTLKVQERFTNSGRYAIVSLPIPVNREGYRAIEHFCFTYKIPDPYEVLVSWTRYSEPRLESSKQKDYRWIYTAAGYKSFSIYKDGLFCDFDFDKEQPRNASLAQR